MLVIIIDFLRGAVRANSKEMFTLNVHKQTVELNQIFREACVLADRFPTPIDHIIIMCAAVATIIGAIAS